MARLDDFNDEPADRAAEALRACNAAPRFAAEVLAGRPYPDADALVARAEEVARALSWDEVSVALAAHPRIGDRPEGSLGRGAGVAPGAELDDRRRRRDARPRCSRATAPTRSGSGTSS